MQPITSRIRSTNSQIKSPWDPLVSRHASFPLDTCTWTAGGSSSLPAGAAASSTSFSLSEESGDEDDDDDEDEDDDDDEDDFLFSLFLDCLSSSSFSFSCLCSSSVSGGRLLREDLLEDRDRAEVGLEDSATGLPGVEDFSDVLCELRGEPINDEIINC